MTDGFARRQGRFQRGQEPRFPAEGADGAASWTGLLRTERLGLLLQEKGKGAFRKSCSGGVDYLLHRVEVDIQTRTIVTEGAARDDFTPVGGERADFLEESGGEFATWHGKSFLVLVATATE